MKTPLLAAALALVLSTSLAPSPAQAAGEADNLDRFFHSLSGRWQGHGKAETVGYHFDLDVTECAASTWTASNTITTDTGDYRQGSMNFQVVASEGQGEEAPDAVLYVSDRMSAWEPVALIETSPRSLTYSVERADAITGRVFHAFFHLEIGANGEQLTGLNTIRQNGVVTWREDLNGQRR
jgi:hypothetical protein